MNKTANTVDQTADIVPNQVLDVPHPNVTVARELDMLPVEIVVRRYLTGSTDTSVWTNYNNGVRKFCGVDLPDGMIKIKNLTNRLSRRPQKQKITTNRSRQRKLSRRPGRCRQMGRSRESSSGIIRTRHRTGCTARIDSGRYKIRDGSGSSGQSDRRREIHTPDSSRYWILDSYEDLHARGEEPESLDKEFLRLWLVDKDIGR